MYYKVYEFVQDKRYQESDYVIIPVDEAYNFFQYHDESNYHLYGCLTSEHLETYGLDALKLMHYYVELQCGIQLYFRKEASMWKWLYEHHDDFRVESYGEYNI